MKSSNKILREEEGLAEIQNWSPVEFPQNIEFSNEMIHSSTQNLFGGKSHTAKEKTRSLFKSDKADIVFQQWQISDLSSKSIQQEKATVHHWVPFLEQPNPKKAAEKIIEDAHLQAKEILDSANANIEQAKQEAYDLGMDSAKAELRETLQGATAIINVAREWRADMMSQAEPMVMDLVKKMAQKMFGDGVVLENAVLQQHFASVLESAISLGDLRIYMNPADAKTLGPDWREYQASLLGHKVEIVSNESIKRGGCYIQGEWGTADALVETQLDTILNQFSEVERPEKDED